MPECYKIVTVVEWYLGNTPSGGGGRGGREGWGGGMEEGRDGGDCQVVASQVIREQCGFHQWLQMGKQVTPYM